MSGPSYAQRDSVPSQQSVNGAPPDCPAVQELREEHAGLFAASEDLRSFLEQESLQVAAFVSAGFAAVLDA